MAAAAPDLPRLSRDVRDWIDAHLQVNPDRTTCAVGGVSAGATCALQLAVSLPRHFPTALVLSAQREPTLGSLSRTVRQRFGGSEAAFRVANPLDSCAAGVCPTALRSSVPGGRTRCTARRPTSSRPRCVRRA